MLGTPIRVGKERIAVWLEENIEDTLNYFSLPPTHWRRMCSTNMLERFNQEIKRRTGVIRIFPIIESCKRLVSALCIEQSEEWQTARRYLTMEENTREKVYQVQATELIRTLEAS